MPKLMIAILLSCCVFWQHAGAQQVVGVNNWMVVSSQPAGEVLHIKLKTGRLRKGRLKSASDTGFVLELKNKELSLSREEIASVAVSSRKSAGKAAVTGLVVGGGAGAGAGAGIGAGRCGS